ncbi:helix-turn-helix transcriptional regulator [Pilimelia columellifera]|uniref:HTH luxR-type domain-containing protein n=1 Tax=Pilimelia columellifera subsp. columellifera TaxID=706583 RepID=A0ABN3N748_9ACTN
MSSDARRPATTVRHHRPTDTARVLQALAAAGPKPAAALARELNMPPARVEHALVTLRRAGAVTDSRPGPAGRKPLRLTRRDQQLLGLLARGHTDASAAARLRISARSVTNILRRLMDLLEVDNRFQLGLALGAIWGAGSQQRAATASADGAV